MFGDRLATAASRMVSLLNAVESTGETLTILSLADVGDFEEFVAAVQARGLHMVGFPAGGLTVLPQIPVADDILQGICEEYCRASTQQMRAEQRSKVYLSGLVTPKTNGLYDPVDNVFKLAELCKRTLAASPEAVAQMTEQSPYLNIAKIRAMFERVRTALTNKSLSNENGSVDSGDSSAAFVQDRLDTFEERANGELDGNEQASLPVFHTVSSKDGARFVDPAELFNKEALEVEADQGPEQPLEDLTGQESVDHVRQANSEYLSEEHYHNVTHSAIFYDGEGEGKHLAAVYIAGALNVEKCEAAARALEPAATKKNMRARTNNGEAPETGIVGYYDYLNNPTQHKCRETSFMKRHFTDVMQGCSALLKDIDNVYRQHAPQHHNLQRIAIPAQFQLFGTVFSTITVNRNFRTAVHTDSGDFRSGLGVLTVLENNGDGCHLAIKKLRLSFLLRPGDVLLFDTSLEHGNTEVRMPKTPWKRVSLVCYLRNGLLSAVCELERRKHLNRLVVASLEKAVGHRNAININSVDESLPPLYVPVPLASKLSTTQMSALTFVAERAKKKSGSVLAMTMGLGKTLVALTLCYSFMHESPHSDILIVVPKPIIQHWVTEHEKWSAFGLHFKHFVTSEDLNGRRPSEGPYYSRQISDTAQPEGCVYVINPEYIATFLHRRKYFDPVIIIADEGHKVASKGNKLILTLSQLKCPLRIVLSGTPLQNNAEELYRLVAWVNSGVHKVVPSRMFGEMEADINRYIRGDDSAFVKAIAAQRYIQDWMKGFVFREMDNDLPPLYDYLLLCGSSATQRRIEQGLGLPRSADGHYVVSSANEHRIYHLSTHPLCYWAFVAGGYHTLMKPVGAKANNEEEPMLYVQLTDEDLREVESFYNVVLNGKMDEFNALSGKLAALVTIANRVHKRNEKMIVFSQYIGTQDLIHRALTACKIPAFTVRGRDSQDRRKEAMEQFDTDSQLIALILSTKIAAYGLDFTAANHVVLFDSWWNPQVDAQAVARAYRRNQTKPVTVYRLASEAEDRSVLHVQTRKLALFNCLMHERTSRSARPGEVQDCADAEPHRALRSLWQDLKTQHLEGGFPVLRNVFRYHDRVKEYETPLPDAVAPVETEPHSNNNEKEQ